MKKVYLSYFIVTFSYIFIAIFFIGSFLISNLYTVKIIGDSDVYVNVDGDYFENGYKAYFGNKVFDEVVIHSNVNTKKVGDYQVYYNIPFLFFNRYAVRNVHVVDKENPKLVLKGNSYIYLNKNQDYIEEGFSAVDNVDGDLTKLVKVDSNLNSNEVGNYKISYRIADSSGNISTAERSVEVINSNILSSSIAEFRFKGQFRDVILDYDDQEYDYLKNAVFLGDSNTVFLNTKGNYLPSHQIWGQFNLNIAQINHSTFMTYYDGMVMNLKSAMEKYHPKYLIVSLGINTANYMEKDDVIREIDYYIEYMQKNYKDTKLFFSSTVPVREFGTASGIYSMDRINKYNYYTVQECHKYGIKFINFTDEIKNAKGFGDDRYLYCSAENDCGFHLSDEGKTKYIQYLKHLNFERN